MIHMLDESSVVVVEAIFCTRFASISYTSAKILSEIGRRIAYSCCISSRKHHETANLNQECTSNGSPPSA